MPFQVTVPNAPGVPNVIFAPGSGALAQLLTGDVAGIFTGLQSSSQWGIYLNGAPVVLADNCLAVDFRVSYGISDYQIEQGGFQSYDKVSEPFEVRVRLSCGGSLERRTAFLASIDAIQSTLELYDVVTPERVFTSVNVSRVNYGRAAHHGLGLISVDIGLEEIRVVSAAAMQSTASPTAQGQQNNGSQQPVAATPTQAAALPFNDGNKV